MLFLKMPEMPEVETLARQLRKTVIGKTIVDIRLSGLSLRRPIPDTFVSTLEGRTIRKILRRGKYLILELDPKAYWLVHLGMSGRILHRAQTAVGTRHSHVVVRFGDATELEYRDHRRFGLMAAYEVQRFNLIPEVRALGMDPLRPGFNVQKLWPLLQKSGQEIKAFLLDQRKIAGLGNIYVCESLFRAGIHPARFCFAVSFEETKHLVKSIQWVLKAAIRNKGTSFSDFMHSDGRSGSNQHFLRVFQREGEKCYQCNTPIRRIRQGTRSSFYCSHCQN
jgi:formamidopyrimidine-DNA glycosylase